MHNFLFLFCTRFGLTRGHSQEMFRIDVKTRTTFTTQNDATGKITQDSKILLILIQFENATDKLMTESEILAYFLRFILFYNIC
jgi:hypothetical protein